MTRPSISTPFLAALFTVLLTTLAGILSVQFPAELYPWVTPVTMGIVATAALVRLEFKAPVPPA